MESFSVPNEDKKVESKADSFRPDIMTDKNKVLCENNHCQIVKNFSLTEMITYNCTEKFLSIEFKATKELIVNGFLDSQSYEIHPKQESSNVCLKIKR